MKTLYDLQQFLKKFGFVIYTGDRYGDLLLMEMELDELRRRQVIGADEFIIAKQVIRNEIQIEEVKKNP